MFCMFILFWNFFFSCKPYLGIHSYYLCLLIFGNEGVFRNFLQGFLYQRVNNLEKKKILYVYQVLYAYSCWRNFPLLYSYLEVLSICEYICLKCYNWSNFNVCVWQIFAFAHCYPRVPKNIQSKAVSFCAMQIGEIFDPSSLSYQRYQNSPKKMRTLVWPQMKS